MFYVINHVFAAKGSPASKVNSFKYELVLIFFRAFSAHNTLYNFKFLNHYGESQ